MSLLYRMNLWLFLPGDYPLTTDTEVKKWDFYAISVFKARSVWVLILIGWESEGEIFELITNQKSA